MPGGEGVYFLPRGTIRLRPFVLAIGEKPGLICMLRSLLTSKVFRCASTAASATFKPQKMMKNKTE